jgi:ABC-2 type transport system permease protein
MAVHRRKIIHYIILIVFFCIGFMLGAGNIAFPNIWVNSPYQLTYLSGILSLGFIFSITFIVAQSLLREQDSGFDALLHSTPVRKLQYCSARILPIALIGIITLFLATAGIFLGNIFSNLPADKKGTFHLVNYLWPYLVIGIPNILLITSLLTAVAWTTKKRLWIYLAGLFIYIIYMVAAIFSNSPLLAGAAPASDSQASISAIMDPLGMAAFFDQSRYWNAIEKNSRLVTLSGNMLINRLTWLFIAAILLIVSYVRYKFFAQTKRTKETKPAARPIIKIVVNKISTRAGSLKHSIQSLLSFARLDSISILKSIPFIGAIVIFLGLLGIEFYNAIQGDPRVGNSYATSALLSSTIMEVLPFFALVLLLFYSSELIWKSRSSRFDSIESSTPVSKNAIIKSRILSLAGIPVFFTALSIAVAIAIQLLNKTVIEFDIYCSLFYYVTWPLVLTIVLIIFLQTLIPGKYAGLLLASAVVLLFVSRTGQLIGISHPLLRYANAFARPYYDMNGFGNYSTAFHWQMLMWTSLAIVIMSLTGKPAAFSGKRKYL